MKSARRAPGGSSGEARSPDRPRLDELEAEYEILGELGRGGTAVVYRALERELAREVAIKIVRSSYVDDEEAIARLAREARMVAQLRHPHIVTLFGTRHLSSGGLALIMQCVPGRTLKQAIREDGPFRVPGVLSVLREIGSALDYAHGRHGIIHRDIKPENIYLDADHGHAMLADFGIARAADGESSLTLVGMALGTPAYMSPEQVDGATGLDGRSDLYSLGLVAYEMLTGRQPWEGSNLYGIIYRQKNEELEPLAQLRPDLPPYLGRAIEGLLRKDRDQRWSDAAQFLAQLRPGATTSAPAGPAPGPGRVVPVQEDTPTVRYDRNAVAATLATDPAGAGAASGPGGAAAPPRPHAPAVRAAPARATPAAASPQPAPTPKARPQAWRTAVRVTLLLLIGTATAPVLVQGPSPVQDEPPASAESVPERVAAPAPAAASATVERVAARGDEPAPAGAAPAPAIPAVAAPAAPARIVVLEGGGREVVRGSAAPIEIRLRVEDEAGTALDGVVVQFRVTAGGGSVSPAQAVAAAGVARASWTPGGALGAQTLVAEVPGTGLRETVTARARYRLAVAPQITAGGTHTCRLAPSGEPHCWGGNSHGQLGTGSTGPGGGSARVAAGAALARLAVGVSHTCGLDRDGAAVCWGINDQGQLGTGDRSERAAPAPVRGVESFVVIAAGLSHTCALREDGAAFCWGAGGNGQLGDGTGRDRPEPTRVAGGLRFTALSAGWSHTCGLTPERVAYCWGVNREGQIGDGTTADRAAPTRVAGELRFASISAGATHTCGVTPDGDAYCWGESVGGAGTGATGRPAKVAAPVRFASSVAGAVHACALTPDGEAYCWGRNNMGQLGNGATEDSPAAAPVAGGIRFSSLTAGGSHTCGRSVTGEDYCWGYNLEGQLGDGSRTRRPGPVHVSLSKP